MKLLFSESWWRYRYFKPRFIYRSRRKRDRKNDEQIT